MTFDIRDVSVLVMPEAEPTSAVDIQTEIEIRKPIGEVTAYAGDPGNAPEWYANIKSVEWRTEPPIAMGSKIAFVAYFLGRKLAYTYEVVELVPNERLIMRTADGPFPMETSYSWIAVDASTTKMKLRNRGTPSGFGRMVAPMMASAMRRANRKDLESIKRILESR